MKDSALLMVGGGLALAGLYVYWRGRGPTGLLDSYPSQLATGPSYAPQLASGPGGRLNPVSGPGPFTQQSLALAANAGPTVRLSGLPSWTDFSLRTSVSAGTGIGIAAVGPGTVGLAATTAGIGAGVAALVYAIGNKGLFRGGEEALLVNPARDRYLEMFGPPGTGPGSGFFVLAAALFEITHDHRYMDALNGADTKSKLVTATKDIQRVFASIGVTVPAFST